MKRDKADHQAIMLCTRHYFFHLSKLNGTWAFPLAYQYFHKILGCLMKLRENSCTMTLPCMLSWCHMALRKHFFFGFLKIDPQRGLPPLFIAALPLLFHTSTSATSLPKQAAVSQTKHFQHRFKHLVYRRHLGCPHPWPHLVATSHFPVGSGWDRISLLHHFQLEVTTVASRGGIFVRHHLPFL